MKNTALLSYGFRPFFILASAGSFLFLGLWILSYAGVLSLTPHGGAMGWHGHEMLFGYTAAVLAGFFLTAVRNWTGQPTLTGSWLGALALLWLAGRLTPFMPEWPARVIGSRLDIVFLPILAAVIARPIIAVKQWRNIGFPIILLVMALGNVLFHLQWMGETQATADDGFSLGLNMILLIIVWVFGRIFPFFAGRVLPDAKIKSYQPVEFLSLASIMVWCWVQINYSDFTVLSAVAGVIALIHLVRLAGFYDHKMWSVPLIWVLFTGYLWLIVGFLLYALTPYANLSPLLARHALTAGAVGVTTLGMIVRVSLGHTGRPLVSSPMLTSIFVFINLAALIRVGGPIVFPSGYYYHVMISGVLWSLCFGAFTIKFLPVLWRPRPDGKPG